MSIEPVIYDFILKAVQDSGNSSAISNAEVHADTYEEIKAGSKWIRIGDVMQSNPIDKGLGRITEANAFIEIQFVARPETPTLDNRRTARNTASEMALEMFAAIENSPKLGSTDGTICEPVIVVKKWNEWRKVSNVRHAVSFLLLKINSRN